MVRRQIADELNISDKHWSCTPVIELIEKVDLMKIVYEVGPFYPR